MTVATDKRGEGKEDKRVRFRVLTTGQKKKKPPIMIQKQKERKKIDSHCHTEKKRRGETLENSGILRRREGRKGQKRNADGKYRFQWGATRDEERHRSNILGNAEKGKNQ